MKLYTFQSQTHIYAIAAGSVAEARKLVLDEYADMDGLTAEAVHEWPFFYRGAKRPIRYTVAAAVEDDSGE